MMMIICRTSRGTYSKKNASSLLRLVAGLSVLGIFVVFMSQFLYVGGGVFSLGQINDGNVIRWLLPQPDSSTQPGLRYTRNDAPSYLRENFILTGYRAHLSLSECTRSIFYLHNETVNIWSHLLPALVFWRLAFLYRSSKKYPVIVSVLCASKALVFSASFFAHTFSPINQDWYGFCWQIDWSAISFAMFGTLSTVVTFGFYHHPRRLRFWMTMFAMSCASLLVAANCKKFVALPTTIKAVAALIPVPCCICFAADLYRKLPVHEVKEILCPMAGPTLLAILGISVYGLQVPERWFPGYFDLTGGSHTMHHLWTTTFAFLILRNAERWTKWRAKVLP